jgi:hypothetical protein
MKRILVGLLFTTVSYAQSSNSMPVETGHRVLACSSTEGIGRIQFYDFVEAREQNQIDIREEGISKEEYLDRVYSKLKSKHPYLKVLLQKEIEYLTSKEVYSEGTQVLSLTNDASSESSFRICPNGMETKSVQVATLNKKQDKFKVDGAILRRMSELDQAGLLVSAGLYHMMKSHMKNYGATNARKLTSALFSDLDIGNSEALNEIFKSIFQNSIIAFENEVLSKWTTIATQNEADEYLRNASTDLPYGIPYKSSITPEALPPLQVTKLQKIQITMTNQGVKHAKIFTIGAGYTFLGSIGIGVLGALDGGYAVIQSVALVGFGITGAGLAIAGGITAAVAIKVAAKKIKLKRIKNFLLEAYLCQVSDSDCSDENFKHLRKSHSKFVIQDTNHSNVTLKQYVDRILKLARNDELMNMRRPQMESYVNQSF